MWDPKSKRTLVSRDVKFVEDVMYKDWQQQQQVQIGLRMQEIERSAVEEVQLHLEDLPRSELTSDHSGGGEQQVSGPAAEEGLEDESARVDSPSQPEPAATAKVTKRSVQRGASPHGLQIATREKRVAAAPSRLKYSRLGGPKQGAMAVQADEGEDEEMAFCFFTPLPGEPATVEEALSGPQKEEWKAAMDAEFNSLIENGTCELVELPEGRWPISSKWVFKVKSGADGALERFRSRLVAKGFQQKEKVDFGEIFAPVVKPMTLRTVLADAAVKGWHVKQMDITTAFLNGILLEDIYMAQPDGYEDGTSRVCKLKKAIYGLKQAPGCWYEKLEEVLLSGGFKTSQADHILFLLGEGEQLLLLLVYVDDILLFSPSMEQIERTQKLLMDNFKCKMLGDVHYYLGLQIERDVERRWLKVHQSHYISGVMERYGVTGGRTVMTPFPAGFKLKKAAEEDDVLEDEQRNEYQTLIGSVMYAAVHTRPDASFGVGQLARVVQRPTEEQLEVAKHLVRYLGSTASAGVQFSAGGQLKQTGADGVTPGTLKLSCFTDTTWASEDEDQSSVGGFVCMVGGGPVSWRSKKQSEIAQTSGEAEYMAMYHAIKEIMLLRKVLEDMGAEQEGPTPPFSDSEAAIGMDNNPILNGLNKHMKINWHWVRQMVKEGIVELHHVKASNGSASSGQDVGPCGYRAVSSSGGGTTCWSLDHSASSYYRRLVDLHCERFVPHAITPHWPSGLLQRTAAPVESHLPGPGPFLAARVETCVSSLGACVVSSPGASRGLCVGAATTTSLAPAFVAGSGATSQTAQLSFTLDPGASSCFFRDCTDLIPLRTPVTVALADPSVGPVVARNTTTLPCPAAPSGFLIGYYTPLFFRNLVGVSHLHDLGVVTTFPVDKPIASCTVTTTRAPLATFQMEPGSGLYSLHNGSHHTGSGQVKPGQVAAVSCDCRSLTHASVLWHHHLGQPSFPRLCRMARYRLVSGLPESLAPLPRSPAPPCTPCVENRQHAAPHSSSFPPTTAPF
ncbi:unnamed protein product [Closterium sp. NIES-54]